MSQNNPMMQQMLANPQLLQAFMGLQLSGLEVQDLMLKIGI